MSGIAATIGARGSPDAHGQVTEMLEALHHRGPDGSGTWTDSTVGLGHVLLDTLPPGDTAPQPLVDGGTVVVADCRIDNQAGLVAGLGVGGAAPSDAELILRAYQRWGEECPAHLRGDFAFVIWDGKQRELLCARDHFGVKPLFWWRAGGRFCAASEIKALLALVGVPRERDERMIANHLRGDLSDPVITYWRGISRVPAAHTMRVGADGSPALRRYWALDPGRELRLASDAEYAEGLHTLFTQAVRRRLRSSRSIGAALSGGLNSTSVACTAARIAGPQGRRIHTFSLVFDTIPEADERRWIADALVDPTLAGHELAGDRLDPLAMLDELLVSQDGAFYAPNLYLHSAMYAEARRHGVGVFLDGLDGDSTIGHGLWRPRDLLLRGRPLAAYSEVRALAGGMGLPTWDVAKRLARRSLLPSVRALAGRWRDSDASKRPLGLRASDRDVHHRLLSSPLHALVLEAADRAAAAHGVEPRYPFYDVDLAEFCLAMPATQKLRTGFSRWAMRQAMEGILPPAVQWRTGKSNLGPVLTQAIHRGGRAAMKDLLDNPGPTAGYLDLAALGRTWTGFLEDPTPTTVMPIWRALVLHRWLATDVRLQAVRG